MLPVNGVNFEAIKNNIKMKNWKDFAVAMEYLLLQLQQGIFFLG